MGLVNHDKLVALKDFEKWLCQNIEQEQKLALQININGFSIRNCVVLHGCEFNFDKGYIVLWSGGFEVHMCFDENINIMIESCKDELDQTGYCIKSKEMELYIDVI